MEKLIELVIKEAINLRKYATEEELNKLDFVTLDGTHGSFCIYGQMTGSCSSERTSDLQRLCTEFVYGKEFKLEPVTKEMNITWYSSPIEKFVYYNKKSLPLVQFLRGEITEESFITLLTNTNHDNTSNT